MIYVLLLQITDPSDCPFVTQRNRKADSDKVHQRDQYKIPGRHRVFHFLHSLKLIYGYTILSLDFNFCRHFRLIISNLLSFVSLFLARSLFKHAWFLLIRPRVVHFIFSILVYHSLRFFRIRYTFAQILGVGSLIQTSLTIKLVRSEAFKALIEHSLGI
jgi:hypothetical protein